MITVPMVTKMKLTSLKSSGEKGVMLFPVRKGSIRPSRPPPSTRKAACPRKVNLAIVPPPFHIFFPYYNFKSPAGYTFGLSREAREPSTFTLLSLWWPVS